MKIIFPLTIKRESDLSYEIIQELLMFYVKQLLVNQYGDYLDSESTFEGKIFLRVHEGKIGKGSYITLKFQIPPPQVKKTEE